MSKIMPYIWLQKEQGREGESKHEIERESRKVFKQGLVTEVMSGQRWNLRKFSQWENKLKKKKRQENIKHDLRQESLPWL